MLEIRIFGLIRPIGLIRLIRQIFKKIREICEICVRQVWKP